MRNLLFEFCGVERDIALFETDPREELCELINGAAKRAGLESKVDVTEDWHKW